VLLLAVIPLRPAIAQLRRDSATTWLVSAGSEGERYLRVLEVAGLSPETQWTVRPFSLTALRRVAPLDSGHPWADRMSLTAAVGPWVSWVQPEVGAILNSTFPYGFNDGPVWAGRGITVTASAGLQGAIGPLQFALAPQVFMAQNAAFPIASNGHTGPTAYGDAKYFSIDLPQRFGAGMYRRFDAGQSTVQLSAIHLTVGASTANEYWGPASESPFLLGNNAAGFLHAFAGTDGPVALGPLTVNLRLIAGRLDQSAYSYADSASGRRYITGVVAAAGIHQLPGLEIGGGRVFENIWPDTGVSFGDVVAPLFQSLLKNRLNAKFGNLGDRPDNQIASLFARWTFPASGFELYGEYGREDNAWDTRDLIVEPDHDVAFMLGFARTWKRPGASLLVLRGELLNSSITDLTRVRHQIPPYVHSPIVQGHTQLGQILGAPSGYAGGGFSLAADFYSEQGRATITLRRMMREPPLMPTDQRDVLHAVTVDGLLLRNRLDLAPELTLVYNANRNGSGDAYDARLALTARAHW
jgi:hypothetical protein